MDDIDVDSFFVDDMAFDDDPEADDSSNSAFDFGYTNRQSESLAIAVLVPAADIPRSVFALNDASFPKPVQSADLGLAIENARGQLGCSATLAKPLLLGGGVVLVGCRSVHRAGCPQHSLIYADLSGPPGSARVLQELPVGQPVGDLQRLCDRWVVAALGTSVSVVGPVAGASAVVAASPAPAPAAAAERQERGSRRDGGGAGGGGSGGTFVATAGVATAQGCAVRSVTTLPGEVRELAVHRTAGHVACGVGRSITLLSIDGAGQLRSAGTAAAAAAAADAGGVVSSLRWSAGGGPPLLSWTTEAGEFCCADIRAGLAASAASPAGQTRFSCGRKIFSHAWLDADVVVCGGGGGGRMRLFDLRRPGAVLAAFEDPTLSVVGDMHAIPWQPVATSPSGSHRGGGGGRSAGDGGGGGGGGNHGYAGGGGGPAATLVALGISGATVWDVAGGQYGWAHAHRYALELGEDGAGSHAAAAAGMVHGSVEAIDDGGGGIGSGDVDEGGSDESECGGGGGGGTARAWLAVTTSNSGILRIYKC